jgi:hypothetical protein
MATTQTWLTARLASISPADEIEKLTFKWHVLNIYHNSIAYWIQQQFTHYFAIFKHQHQIMMSRLPKLVKHQRHVVEAFVDVVIDINDSLIIAKCRLSRYNVPEVKQKFSTRHFVTEICKTIFHARVSFRTACSR